MGKERQITLGMFTRGAGGHISGWRHPEARHDGQLDFPFYVELAATAERGLFDALFFADAVAIWGDDYEMLAKTGRGEHFEPLTVLSALAPVTKHIGLAGTATATYNEPFTIARKFASLDHISNGRAGWNIVTSPLPTEALNFGKDGPPANEVRYERAREFLEIARRLWDGLAEDCVIRDKQSGIYYNPAGLHVPDYVGEYFSVRGPLNMSRPPQGHPVIFQAGDSNRGREFAARFGEVLFTAKFSLEEGQEYYADIKQRALKYHRDPNHILVWRGVSPLVADTEAEAQRRVRELGELVQDDLARDIVQGPLGDIDLSPYSLDEPLPELPDSNDPRQALLHAMGGLVGSTIRQIALRVAAAGLIVGTPEQVADDMETWFTTGGADGFLLNFPYVPGNLTDFVDHVVPELQRRGLYRKEYEGTTLRENLGLPRPAEVWRVGA